MLVLVLAQCSHLMSHNKNLPSYLLTCLLFLATLLSLRINGSRRSSSWLNRFTCADQSATRQGEPRFPAPLQWVGLGSVRPPIPSPPSPSGGRRRNRREEIGSFRSINDRLTRPVATGNHRSIMWIRAAPWTQRRGLALDCTGSVRISHQRHLASGSGRTHQVRGTYLG